MGISIRRDITIEDLWGEIGDCFKSLCVKCLALKRDDSWANIILTGFLSMKDREEIERKVRQEYAQLEKLGVTGLEQLLITHEVFEATRFLEIINYLRLGRVSIRGQLIELGENLKCSIETYSHPPLRSEEPYDFPRISFVLSGTKKWRDEELYGAEEALKGFGYYSIDELGPQWLMLPQVRAYGFNAIIDIPIYFLPLSLNLDGNVVIFRAISHKVLPPKIKIRLALRKPSVKGEYPPIEENYLIECPTPAEEIGEITMKQPLESSLSKDDIISCIVRNERLGILGEKEEKVEYLLSKEVSIADFPKLVTCFINLDALEKMLSGEEKVGGEIKRPDLSFQRAVVWLLSMLGFQAVELEGTKYKEMKEVDGTRREIDVLAFDSDSKTMYIIGVTVGVPKIEEIDRITNLQLSLHRRGIFVKPMIISKDYASEVKRNIRGVKVIDAEEIRRILNEIRMGRLQEAKRLISG